MRKISTKTRWSLYGIIMILLGVLPFARIFVPLWLSKLSGVFERGFYGFYIGRMHIDTGTFWFVYMVVMSMPFVLYGIICLVQAGKVTMKTHTLAQSVSRKTMALAALFGVSVGIALPCYAHTVIAALADSNVRRYPLITFCGSLGGAIFSLLALVILWIYVYVRRRPYVEKGVLLEIGVMFVGVLVGAWLLSAAYNPIELWESTHGYINMLVEWMKQ